MTKQSIPTINQYIALIRLKLINDSLDSIEEIAQELIANLDLKVVKKTTHTYYPSGITLAYILSESHLLIHTWPEFGIVHIDLVTCSYRSEKEVESSLKALFSEQKVKTIEIKSINFD